MFGWLSNVFSRKAVAFETKFCFSPNVYEQIINNDIGQLFQFAKCWSILSELYTRLDFKTTLQRFELRIKEL